MNKLSSIYLDLLRFSAAVLVLLYHATRVYKIDIPFISLFGKEAVVVFFVLSGYVISYVVTTKEKNASSYFSARFIRIFSVMIPALFFTYICDKIGFHINSEYYINARHFDGLHPFSSLLRIVFFTGELLNSHLVFGTNEPIWSIQFEFVYYLAFGVVIYCKNLFFKFIILILLAVLAFPKVLMYFPVWLLGAVIYKFQFKMLDRYAGVIFPLSIALIIALSIVHLPKLDMFYEMKLSLYNIASIVYYYIIGVLVAINIYSAKYFFEKSNARFFLVSYERSIRWLASKTFSLYLIHLPLMFLLISLDPPESYLYIYIQLSAIVIVCFLFSSLFESKSSLFYRFLSKVIKFR
ncbi:TPA: acyltransferase [Klebsiella pneumoniae]|nr:acyltransferase [Klebsiella pneumoniae]